MQRGGGAPRSRPVALDYESEDFDVLEEIARERRTSVASVIRQAVCDYIRRERGK
jgi:hypothetical protein